MYSYCSCYIFIFLTQLVQMVHTSHQRNSLSLPHQEHLYLAMFATRLLFSEIRLLRGSTLITIIVPFQMQVSDVSVRFPHYNHDLISSIALRKLRVLQRVLFCRLMICTSSFETLTAPVIAPQAETESLYE